MGRSLCIVGGVVLAAWLCAAPLFAQDFDAGLLKMRLIPTQSEIDRQAALLQVNAELWKSDEELLALRRHRAMRVSQSYINDNLKSWAKDTPLERLERLRNTEISLDRAPLPTVFGHDVDLSLRVSEQVRLRVTSADFKRDILYDPIDQRMWVDVLEMGLTKAGTGLKLTNTYRLDDASNRMILKIGRPFK